MIVIEKHYLYPDRRLPYRGGGSWLCHDNDMDGFRKIMSRIPTNQRFVSMPNDREVRVSPKATDEHGEYIYLLYKASDWE